MAAGDWNSSSPDRRTATRQRAIADDGRAREAGYLPTCQSGWIWARWIRERAHQQLKKGFGLDHFDDGPGKAEEAKVLAENFRKRQKPLDTYAA